jgi:hypothetical protein
MNLADASALDQLAASLRVAAEYVERARDHLRATGVGLAPPPDDDFLAHVLAFDPPAAPPPAAEHAAPVQVPVPADLRLVLEEQARAVEALSAHIEDAATEVATTPPLDRDPRLGREVSLARRGCAALLRVRLEGSWRWRRSLCSAFLSHGDGTLARLLATCAPQHDVCIEHRQAEQPGELRFARSNRAGWRVQISVTECERLWREGCREGGGAKRVSALWLSGDLLSAGLLPQALRRSLVIVIAGVAGATEPEPSVAADTLVSPPPAPATEDAALPWYSLITGERSAPATPAAEDQARRERRVQRERERSRQHRPRELHIYTEVVAPGESAAGEAELQTQGEEAQAAGEAPGGAGADAVCRRVTVRVAEGQVAPAVVAALRAISREAGAATDSLIASVAVGLARCELADKSAFWSALAASQASSQRVVFSLWQACLQGVESADLESAVKLADQYLSDADGDSARAVDALVAWQSTPPAPNPAPGPQVRTAQTRGSCARRHAHLWVGLRQRPRRLRHDGDHRPRRAVRFVGDVGAPRLRDRACADRASNRGPSPRRACCPGWTPRALALPRGADLHGHDIFHPRVCNTVLTCLTGGGADAASGSEGADGSGAILLRDAPPAAAASDATDAPSGEGGLYALLGLPKDASVPQIRAAYRMRALRMHPDRHPHASAAERAAATRGFQAPAPALGPLAKVGAPILGAASCTGAGGGV